jgi:hypothetical protein
MGRCLCPIITNLTANVACARRTGNEFGALSVPTQEPDRALI